MSKNEKCTCKACKTIVFHCQICKFVTFLLQSSLLLPGFHIVVSVVRKKSIRQLQIYGNLPYKCSRQKKRQIKLFVRDRMNSICPTNFFRTTDTTDTTIWKPGFKLPKREFKIFDATVAKTSFKIASSGFSIYFAIMSVCLTFESSRNYPGTESRGAVSTPEKNIQICP